MRIAYADKITKLHSLETVVEFELDVRKLQKQLNKCDQSGKFELNDVQWKIEACRGGDRESDFLHMSLLSIFDGVSAAWSCEANATFKLISNDGDEAAVHSFEYYNFNKEESKRTIDDFVQWGELFDKHVKEDRAIFEITIKAKTPNRAAKLDEGSAKFDVRVKNVNQLGYEYSNELIVRGIRWKVLVMKLNDHLGISMFANGDDMGVDVYWNVSATFHLISSTINGTISKTFSNVSFDWTHLNHGFPQFVKWNEFINTSKKLIENNHAMFKIELSVSEPIKVV